MNLTWNRKWILWLKQNWCCSRLLCHDVIASVQRKNNFYMKTCGSYPLLKAVFELISSSRQHINPCYQCFGFSCEIKLNASRWNEQWKHTQLPFVANNRSSDSLTKSPFRWRQRRRGDRTRATLQNHNLPEVTVFYSGWNKPLFISIRSLF